MKEQLSLFSLNSKLENSSASPNISAPAPAIVQGLVPPIPKVEYSTVDLGELGKIQVPRGSSLEQIALEMMTQLPDKVARAWVQDGKIKFKPKVKGLPKLTNKLAPSLYDPPLPTAFCHECMKEHEGVITWGVRHAAGEKLVQLCEEAANALRVEGFKLWRLNGDRKSSN